MFTGIQDFRKEQIGTKKNPMAVYIHVLRTLRSFLNICKHKPSILHPLRNTY